MNINTLLDNIFTEHEEREVDDAEHGPKLRGGGTLGAGLDGVKGGLSLSLSLS